MRHARRLNSRGGGPFSQIRAQVDALAILVGVTLLSSFLWEDGVAADGPAEVQSPPLARFITLKKPINDDSSSWVRRNALELQDRAVKEDRRAFLVLELGKSTSEFHHVYALATFLTAEPLNHVTTIAWVPETVTGYNALIALACNEIVMQEDARLGDIGNGQPIPEEQRLIVRSFVDKRRNLKVNADLVEGMMDPRATLLQLTVEPQPGRTERRIVTALEAERMRQTDLPIKDSRTLKEAGTAGAFSGAQARAQDFLVTRTAASRRELADAYHLPQEALREQPTAKSAENARVIQVKGPIDGMLEAFLKRQIDRAASAGATTIIFEIDSPGGELDASRDLAYTIANLKDIRTIAYVPKMAYSGAAMISLGCDEIYLHPSAVIGDAEPIQMKENGQFQRIPEKLVSVLAQEMAVLAEQKKHPTALAKAMIDKDLQVFECRHRLNGSIQYLTESDLHKEGEDWIKGLEIPETHGQLLFTANGVRAHELGLAEAPVVDFDDLKTRLGIPANVEPIVQERTWMDDLVLVLNNGVVKGMLLMFGVMFLFIELHFFIGFFGLISALCFALFFWSQVLGGTAGWLEVTLFLFGVGCIGLEVFVIPGFGVFGVTGGILVMASLVMAMQSFGRLDSQHNLTALKSSMIQLIAAGGTAAFLCASLSKFLPKIPLFSGMILAAPGALRGPQLRPESPTSQLVGRTGVTNSQLRPSGKARIEGKVYDVTSNGPFIPADRPIEVVSAIGREIIVRELET